MLSVKEKLSGNDFYSQFRINAVEMGTVDKKRKPIQNGFVPFTSNDCLCVLHLFGKNGDGYYCRFY